MKTSKKVLLTLGIVLGTIALLAVVLIFVIPGFTYRVLFRDEYPALETPMEAFALSAEASDRPTQTLTYLDFTLDVSTDYHLEKESATIDVYKTNDPDSKCTLAFSKDYKDESDMDLVKELDDDSKVKKYSRSELLDTMEEFGYGRPDNAYNILRLLNGITWDDCPTFGFKKAVLFASLAPSRQLMADAGYATSTYETEDFCCLITDMGTKDGTQGYAVSLYPTPELNQEWLMICRVEDEAEFSDLLGSIRLKP